MTDEMCKAAWEAKVIESPCWWGEMRPVLEAALEAALADEPESADEDVIGKHVWPLQAILAEAHKWRLRNDDVEFPDLDDLEEILLRDTTGAPSPVKRIAELEAKLEEVRALVRTLPDSVKPHRDEFVRILDGKEHRAGRRRARPADFERRVFEDRIAALERDRSTLVRRYQGLEREQAAWVEKLAAVWEESAQYVEDFSNEPPARGVARQIDTLRRCARELRERAKGEPCE